MPSFKYYDAINAAIAKTKREGTDLQSPFDLSVLGADSAFNRLYHRAFDFGVKYGFLFLRKFWPVAKIGRLIIVSRAAQVSQVLADSEHFEVPFGPEMTELAGGEDFVLGLEDKPHADQRATIMKAVRLSDVPEIGRFSRKTAAALIDNSKGRIDVVKDLFTRVSTEVCFSYFGLTATDPDAFADWTLSISALLFADPFGSATTRALALKGSEGVRRVIDRSLVTTSANDDTLLGRLKALQATDAELTDAVIRAILVGLATGLIPTTTLAAGRIVDELLRRPDALRQAREAAVAEDKSKLQAILFEIARLNPALSPGQWRYTRKEQTITDAAGRKTRAPEGSVILVATASALMDSEVVTNPFAFDPTRNPATFGLAFGTGLHECIGKWVAMEIITEVAGEIFRLPGLKPAEDSAGRLAWCGAFPRRLDFVFEPRDELPGFSMPTYAIPLRANVDAAAIKAKISELGNPAQAEIKAAADAVRTLHFVSCSLLELGSNGDSRPFVVIEANADGDPWQATDAVAKAFGSWLGPILAEATGSSLPFRDLLGRYLLKPETRPVGTTGLNFPGLPDFSTRDIEREAELANFAREAVDAYLRKHMGRSARALDVLEFVRKLIRPDAAGRAMIATDPRLADLAERGAQFAPQLLLPSRRQLTLMDWAQPSNFQFAWAILKDPSDLLTIKVPYVLVALAIFVGYMAPKFEKHGLSLSWTSAGDILKALIGALIGALVPFVIAGLAAWFWLRRLETADVPDDSEPSLETITAAAASEDHPGFAQNHFTSVSQMKPGAFRRWTLALALWGVKEVVGRYYRPGFVIDLGTINFARWLRPEGTDKLVFFSNFDGSWHSYLEDFITKAHMGQSAVWSNGVGFPRTQSLIYGGAEDGDRFKRWVRRQQVVTQFWYARFKTLAADVKRANGIIHFGLARAADETEARDWLAQFGSFPRPEGAVETMEAQSIVFRGFKGLDYAVYAVVRLPEDRERLSAWLGNLVGGIDGVPSNQPGLRIAFGEAPLVSLHEQTTAAFVAFSAQGLVRAGFPGERPGQKSTVFPSAFNLGMAARGRILGDLGANAASGWRWSDGENGADALLIVHGGSQAACDAVLAAHEAALGAGSILYRITSRPTALGPGHEPFGFRDGISQPVIKGTRRSAKGAPARDLMEPGEFLLGYRNNSGYYPLSPTVPALSDPFNRLPTLETAPRPDLPSLDAPTTMRDFGRNGSFLAVRQLMQDVDGFHAQAKAIADDLTTRSGVADALGGPPTPELVEAKLMGRWQDGTR